MTLWPQLTGGKLILIAGPCVIESEQLCLDVALTLKSICDELDIVYIFKASYDKANRTSYRSPRGPGIESGLEIFRSIKNAIDVQILTDVHSEEDAYLVGQSRWRPNGELNRVIDVIQIPALLSRQTDLIQAAARTGAIVNIKKGQFSSPSEMQAAANKCHATEGSSGMVMLTERGTCFGYNNLVADMRSIPIMRRFGYPVIFDATHSVQLPGANGESSGGQREFAPVLAQAAVAVGANGIFIETHPDPDRALSDGLNMIPLAEMRILLERLVRIWRAL